MFCASFVQKFIGDLKRSDEHIIIISLPLLFEASARTHMRTQSQANFAIVIFVVSILFSVQKAFIYFSFYLFSMELLTKFMCTREIRIFFPNFDVTPPDFPQTRKHNLLGHCVHRFLFLRCHSFFARVLSRSLALFVSRLSIIVFVIVINFIMRATFVFFFFAQLHACTWH